MLGKMKHSDIKVKTMLHSRKIVVVVVVAITVVIGTLTLTSRGASTPSDPHSRVKRTPRHPHATLRTDGIIRARGYPAETHFVTTEDGYIIEIHRIPSGRLNQQQYNHQQQHNQHHNHHQGAKIIHGSNSNSHPHGASSNSHTHVRTNPHSNSGGHIPANSGGHNSPVSSQNHHGFAQNIHSRAPISNNHNSFPPSHGIQSSGKSINSRAHRTSNQPNAFPPPQGIQSFFTDIDLQPSAQSLRLSAQSFHPSARGSHQTVPTLQPKNFHPFEPYYRRNIRYTGEQEKENATESTTGKRRSRRRRSPKHGNPFGGSKPVVFMMHGILSSSVDWVLNDPDQALGFMMADAGYDVWLGNVRGNYYGKNHVRLSTDHPAFWDYSWNEIAQYDIPAILKYIKDLTGEKAVKYIGHSMGASLLFATLHYHPHINDWLRVIATLAPAAYMHNKMGPHRLLAPFIEEFDKGLRKSGMYELFPLTRQRMEWSVLCNPESPFNSLCSLTYFLINGPNSNYVDKNYLPVISAHTPAGCGLRVFTHLMQIVRAARFQAFDYGTAGNLKKYGSRIPPRYLLSRVTAPTGVLWSDNDWVVDPKDIAITASELPNLQLNYRVPLSDFNHVDFLWAENAPELVYKKIMKFLAGY